jgi:centromeric protein E
LTHANGTSIRSAKGSPKLTNSHPPTPEENMKKSSSRQKIKVKVPKNMSQHGRSLLKNDSSRLSAMHGSETVAPTMDTEPAWDVMNNTISQAEYTNPDSNRNNSYRFDHSFGPMDDNSDIYQNTVRDTVISAMEGYHASVFAYGQTATGKTFTMTGGGGGREGIIQMSIRDCFDYIQSQKSESREYLLRVSFMEIYNEVINDLLASPQRIQAAMSTNNLMGSSSTNIHTNAIPQASNIRIFESKHEGVIVRGLKEEIVTDPEQVFALLAAGERRRQTGSTGMNKHSSRSHSIFRLIIESRKRMPRAGANTSSRSQNFSDETSAADSIASSTFAPASTSGPVRVSTLSLVDLAGSESIKNTGTTGTRQKEGQYINKSLLTLGHVVYKLAEASTKKDDGYVDTMHVPVSVL